MEQARQLTEARAADEDSPWFTPEEGNWLAEGNAEIQQQALRDFHQALANFFAGTHGFPTWRRKNEHEGFRVIGTGRLPAFKPDGTPELNPKTGKQIHNRRVRVERINRKWACVAVPGCGWVKFRLTRPDLPDAKTCRVRFKGGRWHVAFATVPTPIPAPGNGKTVGVDRGVTITAALSGGRMLNCPQLTPKERARLRKHKRRADRAPKGSAARKAEYAKAARIKAKEAARRKDWCEKTSTMLARDFDVIRFEKLNIKNMTASAKGTVAQPGTKVRQKTGLNRAILAQGWGLLRARTGHKAPGRVQDVPAPYTSLKCSECGWIDKNSRKSQALFVCSSCEFTCNADTNAGNNIAASKPGTGGPDRQHTQGAQARQVRKTNRNKSWQDRTAQAAPDLMVCAGGTAPPTGGPNVREPQPEAGIPALS